MSSTCVTLILILTLHYNALFSAALNLHPILQTYLSSSSAVRIRILPRAVAYLNGVAAEILAEQLPRLSIPNIKQRINNGQGNILLSRIRVSRYKRASQHTVATSAPNKITWIMKNLNMGLIGDLSGLINIVVPVKLEGEAEVLARGVNFHLESALERSETGAARVSTLSCRTTIQSVNIEIYNGGVAGMAVNLFKQGISEHVRPFIQALICKRITQFINEDLNKKLSQTQTKTSLADAVRTNSFGALVGLPDSEQLMNSVRAFNVSASYPLLKVGLKLPRVDNPMNFWRDVHLPSRCYCTDIADQVLCAEISMNFIPKRFDVKCQRQLGSAVAKNRSAFCAEHTKKSVERLSDDPKCYTNTVEIANLGEISIVGANRKRTPFNIPPLSWTAKPVPNAMIHLLVSDYIANALLYHAFSEHLLQFVVDDRTVSSLGPLLRTSCTTGICFADLIPQIAKQYPNKKVRLIFTPTRAPVMLFQAKQNGVLTVNVNGLVFLYIVAPDFSSQQAAAFALDVVASTHLHIRNSTLMGKTSLDSFRLQNKYGNMNISDDELSDIALLSSEMLQRSINDFLRAGFPIPIPKVLRIKATELQILDRSVFVSTEFALDRRRVSVIALEAFADTKYFPRSARMQSGSVDNTNK